MGDISEHFNRREFACQCGCGCGKDTVDFELLVLLEELRTYFGLGITINSGHRCEKWNETIGGSKNSLHLAGRAADIVIKDIIPSSVYQYIDEHYPDRYGLGKYPNFTHVDARTHKARW